jgi:hypothetical protein
MSATAWVIIGVVVAIIVILVAVLVTLRARRRRRMQLQHRFGDEYDRTVDTTGDRKTAERDLSDRAERRDAIELHEISAARRQVIVGEWVGVQASFVDDPAGALRSAARLVHQTMTERGYPDGSPDDDVDLVSVDHPDLVPEFRRAHETNARVRNGTADTEALRRALLRYRAVFDRLLEPPRPRAESSR